MSPVGELGRRLLAEVAAGEGAPRDVELSRLVGAQPHTRQRPPHEVTLALVKREAIVRLHDRHEQVLGHPVDRGHADPGEPFHERRQPRVAHRGAAEQERAQGRPGPARSRPLERHVEREGGVRDAGPARDSG